MEFLWIILVGLIAGWLASILVRGGGLGLVGNIVVGVIGALLGGFLAGKLGFTAGGGFWGSIVTATMGAVVLLVLLRLLNIRR
jgi:uncharacterized membrane protein YeaQ/YmgE (transglycosylase-associated protein family)